MILAVAPALSVAVAPAGAPDLGPCTLGPARVLVADAVVAADPVGDLVADTNVVLELKWS